MTIELLPALFLASALGSALLVSSQDSPLSWTWGVDKRPCAQYRTLPPPPSRDWLVVEATLAGNALMLGGVSYWSLVDRNPIDCDCMHWVL